ncbi:MAG: TPM domain-containing protein [Algibacter sp.]
MKKGLIIIGSIGILYFFLAYALPYIVSIPLAYYNSNKNWTEFQKEPVETKLNKIVLDSIGGFPFPIGSVSDYENIFTENQTKSLTDKILEYEQKTTREIAIVSIKSIEPYDNISKYATDLSNEWGIGKTKKDNGLLILFSKSLRKIRISTGHGTEKILTDEICKKVIDQTIIPELKNGNYYSGIEKGLAELIVKWK